MQPPNDTQRFPAHERPENQYAPTEQFAAASGGSGPGGSGWDGSGSGASSRTGRGGRTGLKVGIGAAVVLILLVVGAIGVELGMRKSVSDRLNQEITSALGSPAQVDLGSSPVILSFFDKTIDSVHITTDGTPAEGATGPTPAIDITAEGLREDGNVTHVASLSGTAFVSDQTMTTAAQSESQSGGDSMLAGLIQVQDVVSDPAAGNLRVSISGLAEAVVTPRLNGGELVLEPETASVFGFELPSSLLGGTISMMDSALAELPEGVEITGVRVVEGGMTVDLSGTDVVLESTG